MIVIERPRHTPNITVNDPGDLAGVLRQVAADMWPRATIRVWRHDTAGEVSGLMQMGFDQANNRAGVKIEHALDTWIPVDFEPTDEGFSDDDTNDIEYYGTIPMDTALAVATAYAELDEGLPDTVPFHEAWRWYDRDWLPGTPG